ncbi:MAG TPA: FAD-binding oxidoreductase [Steroidobacteraceae bacterium]|jgi:glycine/D-amino acid oxidase-like deaminating enzyme|nr:FAD-binding oxidoreductase [Steroidobacteraceae bacterium]
MPAVPLQSLWSATAPAGPALGELTAARRAHTVIVGAGYTGLSAALHLALAGREVAVLDAVDVGERASGLNGGQVIPGVKHDPDTLEEMFGPDLGARLVATVASAADLVFELIARHAIQCDDIRTGWIQPATSERALAGLARRAQQWRRRGAPLAMLSREEVKALTGSERYCGGLLDRRGGTLQPLAFVRGLAQAVLRAGGQVFTHSPAIRLIRVADDWRIDTPQGSVTAPTVILATNAYTDKLAGALRRTLVPVPSFQVATQPLPPLLRGQILPQRQAASDTRHLLRYFRTDASGRFVLGSRGTFAAAPGLKAVRHQYRAVHEIFPQLDGIPFEYHWGGWVAITRDHLPHLHELAPGVLAGLGYNGRGVAMATMMGRLLAQRTLGAPATQLGFPVTPVRPIRLHALSGLGARATIQYLRMVDAWGVR